MRNIIIAMVAFAIVMFGLAFYLITQISTATEDCKGLKEVVELVWTGDSCGDDKEQT